MTDSSDAGKLPTSVIVRIVMASLIVSAIVLFLGYAWAKSSGRDSIAEHVFLGILTIGPLLALYGLVRRTSWGRWFALGTSLAGLTVLGSLALVYRAHLWLNWQIGAVAAGFVVLGLCLVGGTMAEQFEFRDDSRGAWRGVRRERQARLLNLVPILSLSAVPVWLALLAGSPGLTRWWLPVTALAATAAGVALLLAQRTAGMLLLIAASVISTVVAWSLLTASAYLLTEVMWTAGYALLPAAFGGLLGVAALALPAARALRANR